MSVHTPGPTIPATGDSQVLWLDAESLAVCGEEWLDVYTFSADGQPEMVRSIRMPSHPWDRVYDAPRKRLYSWASGSIQALDLTTLEPLFTVLPLDKGRTVRIDPSGRLDTQDPEVEKEFIYYIANPDGTTTLHTPAEFRKLMGWDGEER